MRQPLLRILLRPYKTSVQYTVLAQNDEYIPNNFMFTASNDWRIVTSGSPELSGGCMYLRGSDSSEDNRLCQYSTRNPGKIIEQILAALIEFAVRVHYFPEDEAPGMIFGVEGIWEI